MSHKNIALSFLKMAEAGNYREAYDKYIAPNFIHHNQYFKGDRESLLRAMEESSKTSPNKSIEVKYIYEDGDSVITHSLVTRMKSDELSIAVIHIFKIQHDKVVELWDLGQQIQKDSPNENGLF